MSSAKRHAIRAAIGAGWIAISLLPGCAIPGPDSTENDLSVRAERNTALLPAGAGGHSLSFLRGGDPSAERVIFIHGTPGDATGWADYVVDPPKRAEAIAVDRLGFGLSGPRVAVPALGDQARAIAPLLVERGGRLPILVGHSLGAAVAVKAALDMPGRVDALVLVAGSLDPDLEHVVWIQRVGRWRAVEWMLPRWARNANRELIALEAELRGMTPRIPEIRCPVVILHGSDDPLVPVANVAYLETHLADNPRVEVRRLEGRNHFLPWNAQGDLRRAITRARELAEGASR